MVAIRQSSASPCLRRTSDEAGEAAQTVTEQAANNPTAEREASADAGGAAASSTEPSCGSNVTHDSVPMVSSGGSWRPGRVVTQSWSAKVEPELGAASNNSKSAAEMNNLMANQNQSVSEPPSQSLIQRPPNCALATQAPTATARSFMTSERSIVVFWR